MEKHIYTGSLLKILSFCFMVFVANNSNAQNASTSNSAQNENKDSVKPDTMNCHASFPGGVDSMFLYINNNLKYPEDAVKTGKEGKVIFDYTVDVKGKIKNIRIKDDSGLYCKEAIKSLFEGMPEWKVARKNGIKIEQKHTMVISYNLKYAPGGKLEPDKFTFWRI